MHDIEPHFKWRDHYTAERDKKSPFYGRSYSEFSFTNQIYNYYIHPQWDNMGSNTLYLKLLFTDYEKQFAIIELIGEWNDCLYNDIMFLKREVIDVLIKNDITKFILIGENVLNFHSGDNCYYEEWYEDIRDEDGWITFLNLHEHVTEEMTTAQIQFYCNLGGIFNEVNWRPYKPQNLFEVIDAMVNNSIKSIDS